MNVSHTVAMKLWVDVFGSEEWAQDCFGTWMHKDAYSNQPVMKIRPGYSKEYDYSWNVDHIRPTASYENPNDSHFMNNYEPMHRQNNVEKSDDYEHFNIEGKKYVVFKQDGYNGYGIRNVQTGKDIDWKSKQKRNY